MYCELPPSRICSPSRTIRPPCTRALNVALRPHQQIVLISSIQAANEKLEKNTELIRAVLREHAAIAQTEEEYHHKYDPLMAEHEVISARLDRLRQLTVHNALWLNVLRRISFPDWLRFHNGRILTPDGLRFIYESLNRNPEAIGKHMLEVLAQMQNDCRHSSS